MTNPDDPAADERPAAAPSSLPPARSGSGIVVGMLIALVAILWTFDLVVTAFGPPEAGMSIRFENASPHEWRVLVCGEPGEGWAALFDADAPGGRLLPDAVRSLHLIEEPGRTWTLALVGGDPQAPVSALLDLRADAERQVVVLLGPDGEPRLREGPALISHARQHMLEERAVSDANALRSRALLPELPSAGVDLPDAPDDWSFGPLDREG